MKAVIKKIAVVLLAVLMLCMAGFAVWCEAGTYPASDAALNSLSGSDGAQVTQTEYGWYFDGAGERDALIFYPGALVAAESYAPLLLKLAENGVDCFLVKMPLNFALLGTSRAEKVFDDGYEYERWYIGGHSLGGACASMYLEKRQDCFDGLVFLAAYASGDLSGRDISVLSIYGSEDGVLNFKNMENGRSLLPENVEEYRIEGGNHAYFGDYGEQRGDGAAAVSREEQQDMAADYIAAFILTQ